MRADVVHILVLVGLLACESPFSTRQPETPDDNSQSFIDQSTPENVFNKLRLSLAERNVENYIRTLVDTTRSNESFVFTPDRGVAAQQPETFANWGVEQERHYFVQLFQSTPSDSTITLRLLNEKSSIQAQTATFTYDYIFLVEHLKQEEGIPSEYRGQSKFSLERNETGDWAIFRWEDFSNGNDPSWTQLKAFFR